MFEQLFCAVCIVVAISNIRFAASQIQDYLRWKRERREWEAEYAKV
jgi:hypothetical protein